VAVKDEHSAVAAVVVTAVAVTAVVVPLLLLAVFPMRPNDLIPVKCLCQTNL
jgi:hypothetical protein